MITNTGITIELATFSEWTNDGKHYRREEWTIRGGEIDPQWRREGIEPSARFTLYVVNGELDRRLASFGGVVWPTAWADLFVQSASGTLRTAVQMTDLAMQYRAAALLEKAA